MTLPSFLVVGAMKCATTSLCDLLQRHPKVFICEPKEPDFFCRVAFFDQGMPVYEQLFRDAPSGCIVGEGSTSYSKAGAFPGVAARISTHLPDARLIYIMRDPIRRIESHWMHTVRTGYKPPSINRLHLEPGNHYIDTSLYWHQLAEYRSRYDESRFLLLFYEDFIQRPEDVLRDCLMFLGLDTDYRDETAGEARHVSVGSRVDGAIIQKLNQNRIVKGLAKLLPRSMRDTLKRPLQTTVTERPIWHLESLERTLEIIRPDALEILKHCGKATDYWPLMADAYVKHR